MENKDPILQRFKGGLSSFINGVTEKGLELAEGAKCVQKHLPETYKGIKKARELYVDREVIAKGRTNDQTGKAAQALSLVVDGLGKDLKSKIGSLLSKFMPKKKESPKIVSVNVPSSNSR